MLLTKAFATQEQIIESNNLLAAANAITPDTGPHDNDDNMPGWSERLYNLANDLDGTVATIAPHAIKEFILESADNSSADAHGHTTRAYIQLRFNQIEGVGGPLLTANNQLLQVVGWALNRQVRCEGRPSIYENLLDISMLCYLLIPINDSTSAMYNVFFVVGANAVANYTNRPK